MSTRCMPDAATMRALAVRADVDPRTLAKELRGIRTRGMAGHRARKVLADAGFLPREAEPPETPR